MGTEQSKVQTKATVSLKLVTWPEAERSENHLTLPTQKPQPATSSARPEVRSRFCGRDLSVTHLLLLASQLGSLFYYHSKSFPALA